MLCSFDFSQQPNVGRELFPANPINPNAVRVRGGSQHTRVLEVHL